MSLVRKSGTAGTADPVPAEMLQRDVSEMMDVVAGGGIAIIPLDLTYAIVGHRADAVRRIFAAKNRSFDKPCGMFGSWRISQELHDVSDEKHAIVRSLVEDEGLPFSVVAPFRSEHPLLASMDPDVIRNSSLAGTMDMVINGGYWLTNHAGLAYPAQTPDPGIGQAHLFFQIQGNVHRIIQPAPYIETQFKLPPWM